MLNVLTFKNQFPTSRGVLQQEKYERKERDTACYMPVSIKSGVLMYVR